MRPSPLNVPVRAHDPHAEIARLHQVVTALEQQLEASRAEHRQACEQLVAANQGSSDMLKLSVALCRLYEAPDRDSAIAGLREIVINVIGSESFAVYTVDGASRTLAPLTSMGVSAAAAAHDLSGASLAASVARIGRRYVQPASQAASGLVESGSPLACVPLKLGDRIEGVLVVHDLLAHKPALEPFDVDILDLLTTHAMSAMRVASLRAAAAA